MGLEDISTLGVIFSLVKENIDGYNLNNLNKAKFSSTGNSTKTYINWIKI